MNKLMKWAPMLGLESCSTPMQRLDQIYRQWCEANHESEVEYLDQAVSAVVEAGVLDTVIALVERGPVNDGDLPSKEHRDQLAEIGLVMRIASNGEFGPWAAGAFLFYVWRRHKELTT